MEWVKNFLKKLVYHERSAQKLALSFCMGAYIAFSPFPGFHTLMTIVFTWLFGLNFTVTLASSCFINNPWTMVPVYGADYGFGYWLLNKFFNINVRSFEPAWMQSMSAFFEYKLGMVKPCIWSFLIGGNILGLVIGILLYPIMKKIFARYLLHEFGILHENNYAK